MPFSLAGACVYNYFRLGSVRGMSRLDDLLERTRARLDRVDPERAAREMEDGAVLGEGRSEAQRQRDGVVPGALSLPRNALEWRPDPEGQHPAPRVGGRETRV